MKKVRNQGRARNEPGKENSKRTKRKQSTGKEICITKKIMAQ
jgi:hypothetical protein